MLKETITKRRSNRLLVCSGRREVFIYSTIILGSWIAGLIDTVENHMHKHQTLLHFLTRWCYSKLFLDTYGFEGQTTINQYPIYCKWCQLLCSMALVHLHRFWTQTEWTVASTMPLTVTIYPLYSKHNYKPICLGNSMGKGSFTAES